jgi:hypothetical protein
MKAWYLLGIVDQSAGTGVIERSEGKCDDE